MQFLKPAALFDGRTLHRDKVLRIEDGCVSEIVSVGSLGTETDVQTTRDVIASGFFDVQVNGGCGVMLNNMPTPEGVQRIAKAHRNQGTSYILPTVITDVPQVMERAADAVISEVGKNGVLGIHIEGPHINAVHKGTHNPAFIRPFDATTLAVLERLRARDVPVLLTLAPETVPPGLIARLTRMGVVVSAGHTAANAEETRRALAEGLRCFTHLFNGMPALTSRIPMITCAAINSRVWCGIIADGHHVDYEMLTLAVRARPVLNRMVLVSDSMSTIGGPDHFELYGETIRLEGGRLINSQGSLAGAHIDLRRSVQHMISRVGVSEVSALRMGCVNPFEMMRIVQPGMLGLKLDDLGRVELPARFPRALQSR